MADFSSNAFGSLFYNIGGRRDTLEGGTWRVSCGSTILARVQEILISWAQNYGPTVGWRVDAYRRGGPLGAPRTSVDLRSLAVDRDHGPVTNGALWAYCAIKSGAGASYEAILDGEISNEGARNALDKIEESLASGTLTLTAARVMLWVIEHQRDPSLTWARFVAEQTPDFNRPLFRGYALRRPLPLGATPSALMILDTDQPARVRHIAVVSLTHCLRIGSSMTAEQVKERFRAVPATMGAWQGDNPRVTRTYAGLLESCMERVRARWPIVVELPDPAAFIGSEVRFARSIVDALRAGMPDAAEWEISVDRYDAAVNGPLAEWAGGALANTATRESAIAGVEENADGPSSLRPRAEGTADRVVAAVGTLAGAAMVVSGLWFGGRVLGVLGTRSTVTKREVQVLSAPKPNPKSKSSTARR